MPKWKVFTLAALCGLAACDPYSRYAEFDDASRARFIAAEKACRSAVLTIVGPGVLSRTNWDSGGDPNNDSVGVRFFSRKKSDDRFWFCEVYPDGTIFRLTVGLSVNQGKDQIDLLPEYMRKTDSDET